MKKIIALTLALIMSLTCFSLVSFAEETETTVEHLTEVPEGYKGIYTVEDLYWVRNDLTANYILMNDIDLSEATAPNGSLSFMGSGWEPIGSNNYYGEEVFSGVFDGNGFAILGMNITVCKPTDVTEKVNIGLFAKNSGKIKNLLMRDCFVSADIVVPSQYKLYVGFIAAQNIGIIENCFVINSNITVNECFTYVRAGGISGLNNGFITSSVFLGLVDIFASGRNSNEKAHAYAGGIAGSNVNGTIEKSINLGEIKSYADGVSGLNSVGHHWSEPGYYYSGGITAARGTIKNCYNKGKIDNYYGGGIAYDADSIINCYSVGNSSFAISSSATVNSYYIVGSGSSCSGATEYTDFLMQQAKSYSNWDFDTIWTMDGRADYPYPELRDVPLVLPDDLKTEITGTVTITGEATVGSTLKAEIKDLTPADAEIEYEWKADGVVVGTGDSYTITQDDAGKEITLSIKGAGDFKGSVTSSAVVGECAHSLGEYTNNNDATCDSNATKFAVCELCGETVTEEIENSKLAHIFENYVFDNNATCIANGTKTAKCENCSATDAVVAEGTKTGHAFAEWTTITTANCTQQGVAIRTCRVCDLIETQKTPVLGHTDKDGDNKCDECKVVTSIPENSGNSGETIIVEKDNVFSFLKSFLNTLIEFIRSLLKI